MSTQPDPAISQAPSEATSPASSGAQQETEDPTSRMSFFEHLVELRKRILLSLAWIGGGVGLGMIVSDKAYQFLAQPMMNALKNAGVEQKLVYTSPMGPLMLYLTVGFYLGLVIALPFVLHQVWLFVAPGLYKHERRAVVWFIGAGTGLFLAGAAFGYYLALPMTLKFLLSIPGPFVPMISINEYFDMSMVVLMGLGLVFQLPILIFFLALFGIVTPKFLWKNFRYAILVIAIIAAAITPTTDALTMLVFMAPMILLYVVGIGVAAVVLRGKRKRAEQLSSAGAA
ncbi:MAG TPA: twin-arginine translocase subunit TatC [Patescibacteria group bacterium]|nr:twin-arginine translocase subunit TatC [Patescibacteria group bacterium]